MLWLGVGLVGLVLLFWLASVARRGVPTWPVADGALIEIYTMHATRGDQLLGAYSQYGWYHPGPLLFYLLAPFYVLGGRTLYGLDLGALVISLSSLLLIASILARRRGMTPLTATLLLIGLFVYFLRLPDLLTSAWNPHVSVWPFAALLVCTAATVSGDLSLLPVVVLLASFVTQTHVGFTPVSLALVALALAALIWHAASGRSHGQLWPLALLSLVVVQLVWLPAFAEELSGHPGNLTKLWRFFVETAETQTLTTSLRAWNSMLMGVLRGDFALPKGWGFGDSSPILLIAIAVLSTAALPAVVIARWRDGHGCESALAGVCLIATAVGFWSVVHIRGPILDNQLFWLSVLGVFDLSLALALVVSPARRWLGTGWLAGNVVGIAAAVLVLSCVVVGVRRLVAETESTQRSDESESVRLLSAQVLETFPSMGARRPLFRIDGPALGIGFGLLLQMRRASMPATMDPAVASRFDPRVVPDGQEDVLVTLSGLDEHQQLALRPGNVTIAKSNWRVPLYVDAVSLIDHPEFRSTGAPGTP